MLTVVLVALCVWLFSILVVAAELRLIAIGEVEPNTMASGEAVNAAKEPNHVRRIDLPVGRKRTERQIQRTPTAADEKQPLQSTQKKNKKGKRKKKRSGGKWLT